MSEQELPKAYEHKGTEDEIYKNWEESGSFAPPAESESETTFTISIPPPNATGKLHIGHAMMLAVEDLMVRYHRLKGDATLWLPGQDHAAIATQNVVEKQIWDKEKKDRHQIGRTELLKRIDEFVEATRDTIRQQFRKMGSSLDWSRERYTLDEGLSRAVRMVFRDMYNDGLIYRGDRVVNWCTRCNTTLADDEVEYKEVDAKLYTFKYGHDFPISISTTRPETKVGDNAVAVNPKDERYKELVGKTFAVDFAGAKLNIKIVTDPGIEQDFGTGALGVTPAHSLIDAQIAEKNGLDLINVIGQDGRMTDAAGSLAGMTVAEAKEAAVDWLKKEGLLEKEEDIKQNLSVCYRCGTPVEPLVSKQWFVNVNKPIEKFGGKSLREKSLEVVRNGEIKIVPDRFEKTYFNWMENLHDWCISRQIWFGHRIPVWYKGDEIYVGLETPEGEGWTQDEDTLDTWFSSGLWTFSTLLNPDVKVDSFADWREQSPDLKRFHPTSVLETGYDILFFWIARMIIMTTYAMEEVPFKNVYLHGIVRDEQGRKMSKSLDNGIDPLDVIEKYGADPVRLSLIIGVTPGNDARSYDAKIAGYRNFVNKLWNISRYILMTTKETYEQPEPKTLADRWILAEFNELKKRSTDHIENFRFSPAGEELYEFTWSKLADWYVEVAKVEGNKDAILRHILSELLVLWHPYTPYVTEHIWSQFNNDQLITQSWPTTDEINADDINNFTTIQNVVSAARDLKQELGSKENIEVVLFTDKQSLFEEQKEVIERLAKVDINFGEAPNDGATKRVLSGVTVYTNTEVSEEVKKRQAKEKTELENYIKGLRAKLDNKEFRANAPAEIVQTQEAKLKEAEDKLAQLN